jgi:hypothetical protein
MGIDLLTVKPFEIYSIRPLQRTIASPSGSRNCYWNKCGFCPAYKFGARFSKRSIEEVKEDIRRAKLIDDLLIVHRFPHWQTLFHAMSKWVTLSPYIVDRHNLN